MSNANVEEIATAWLREMETCVRKVDFARARLIFSEEVTAFGSVSGVLDGLDALERDQWRHVWPAIRDFTFETDELRYGRAGDLVWIACPWISKGRLPDDSWQNRPGRMTAVLTKVGERWLAVHTHHSLAP